MHREQVPHLICLICCQIKHIVGKSKSWISVDNSGFTGNSDSFVLDCQTCLRSRLNHRSTARAESWISTALLVLHCYRWRTRLSRFWLGQSWITFWLLSLNVDFLSGFSGLQKLQSRNDWVRLVFQRHSPASRLMHSVSVNCLDSVFLRLYNLCQRGNRDTHKKQERHKEAKLHYKGLWIIRSHFGSWSSASI